MNSITIAVGCIPILFGVYTVILRVKSPESLSKLVAMKEKFGDSTGNIIHIVFYSITPVALGIIIILAGLNGVSISEL